MIVAFVAFAVGDSKELHRRPAVLTYRLFSRFLPCPTNPSAIALLSSCDVRCPVERTSGSHAGKRPCSVRSYTKWGSEPEILGRTPLSMSRHHRERPIIHRELAPLGYPDPPLSPSAREPETRWWIECFPVGRALPAAETPRFGTTRASSPGRVASRARAPCRSSAIQPRISVSALLYHRIRPHRSPPQLAESRRDPRRSHVPAFRRYRYPAHRDPLNGPEHKKLGVPARPTGPAPASVLARRARNASPFFPATRFPGVGGGRPVDEEADVLASSAKQGCCWSPFGRVFPPPSQIHVVLLARRDGEHPNFKNPVPWSRPIPTARAVQRSHVYSTPGPTRSEDKRVSAALSSRSATSRQFRISSTAVIDVARTA